MTLKYKILSVGILVLAFVLLGNYELMAQCPMCRMSAETNLQNGGTMGKGLNKGILYMLSLPYLLVGTLGYIWWRNRRKFTSEIIEESFSNN